MLQNAGPLSARILAQYAPEYSATLWQFSYRAATQNSVNVIKNRVISGITLSTTPKSTG
jgi:hypothetical protein